MLKQNEVLELLNLAIECATEAGEFILKNKNIALKFDYKGRVNLVTRIDRQSEEIIIAKILKKYPGHGILSEERSPINTDSPFRWIIDPLDGTTNFVHNFPFYAVSIGIEYSGKMLIGVVYAPETQELFTAIRAKGAFLNAHRIRVSQINNLQQCILATGFPYELIDHFYENMEHFKSFYEKTQGVRRAGSAAIDLSYTACGRFDGFWEFDLNPWDSAAGSLIVAEAGGKVTNFAGGKFSVYQNQILASNSLIHEQMIEVIKNIKPQ